MTVTHLRSLTFSPHSPSMRFKPGLRYLHPNGTRLRERGWYLNTPACQSKLNLLLKLSRLLKSMRNISLVAHTQRSGYQIRNSQLDASLCSAHTKISPSPWTPQHLRTFKPALGQLNWFKLEPCAPSALQRARTAPKNETPP